MLRSKIHTAFNPFFHTEADNSTVTQYRKAVLSINGAAILSSGLLAHKINNTFTFELNKILKELYALNQPAALTTITEPSLTKIDSLIKTLSIRTTNIDDTNPSDADYTILLGKIHPEKFIANHTNLSTTTDQPLTNLNAYRLVSPDQPLYFYALTSFELFNNDTITITLTATFEFTDGSLYTHTLTTQPADNFTIYQYATTLDILTSILPSTQAALTIATVAITYTSTIGTETQNITPTITIVPDYQYYPDAQTIIYLNPFGLYESIRFTGQVTRENEIFSESILNQGHESTISSRYRKRLSLTLAIDHAQNTEAIIDDLSYSNVIYWLLNCNAIKLVKDFKTLKSFDSTTQNDTPTLDFRLPYEY